MNNDMFYCFYNNRFRVGANHCFLSAVYWPLIYFSKLLLVDVERTESRCFRLRL